MLNAAPFISLYNYFYLLIILGVAYGIEEYPISNTSYETDFKIIDSYDCPLNCSSHGVCVDDYCKCDDNWTGIACQNEIIDLNPDTPIKRSISYEGDDNLSRYVYLRTTIQSGDYFKLRTTSENCNISVYSKYNDIPEISKYDYVTIGGTNITDHHIISPSKGVWIHGITSSVNCTFTSSYTMNKFCPLDCSGHGTCNYTLGICKCLDNYTGDDCSIPVYTLKTQTPFSNVSISGKYTYYKMEVDSNIIDVEIIRDIDDNTCDAYLGYNFLPTLSNYTYMLEHSINSKNLSIHIDNPSRGTWYIAVWGCREYNYTILPVFSNMCPNNCSGHGTCKNGVCSCNTHYTSHDCSKYIRTNFSDSFIEEFQGNQWKYFKLNVSLSSEIAIIVNSVSTESSFNIYYDLDAEPTTFKYKKFKRCENSCSLIDKIEKSTVWVGIHNTNTQEIKLNVSITNQKKCPNDCNNHGRCIAGKCICDENYTISDCSIYMEHIPNSLNTAVNGVARKDSMNYYRVNVGNYSSIIFNIFNINKGKIDVFLKNDSLPTRTENLKRFYNVSANLTIEVTSAEAKMAKSWYLAIYGVDDLVNYKISGGSISTCPRNCSGNGECVNGVCHCTEEWTTIDCSIPIVDIPPNLQLRGTALFELWDYYTFKLTTNEAFQIIVEELISPNRNGCVHTYLGKGRLPNRYEYDYMNSTYKEQSIIIPANISKGTWFIGITTNYSEIYEYEGIDYRLIVATGCESYLSCNQCILDPNCGWCRANLQDSSGLCVPGNNEKALNQTCLFYQFSTCEIRNDKLIAPSSSFIIGLVSGIGAVILVFIITFFVYREYRKIRKERMKPQFFKSNEEEFLFNDETENETIQYNKVNSSINNETIVLKNNTEEINIEDLNDKDQIIESEENLEDTNLEISEQNNIESYGFDENKEDKMNIYTDSDSMGDVSSDSDEEYNISNNLL